MFGLRKLQGGDELLSSNLLDQDNFYILLLMVWIGNFTLWIIGGAV